jgi:hypothetical protein
VSSQVTSVVIDQEFNAGTDACVRMYLIVAAAGVCGGCVGAYMFWKIYRCVVFCLGCQVGMFGFMVILVGAFASAIVHNATGVADILIQQPDLFYILAFVDLVVGVITGWLFLKFQKFCIMAGTAFLGSQMVASGIVDGFLNLSRGGGPLLSILTVVGAVGGFFIQWKFTSQGVNIDPKTGAVTVVIITPRQPAYPAATYAHPAAAYPAAVYPAAAYPASTYPSNIREPLMQGGPSNAHTGAAIAVPAARSASSDNIPSTKDTQVATLISYYHNIGEPNAEKKVQVLMRHLCGPFSTLTPSQWIKLGQDLHKSTS